MHDMTVQHMPYSSSRHVFICRSCLQRSSAALGMVTTLERKQRIYEICSEHDIIIIEDDPYFYLQYSLGSGAYFAHIYACPKTAKLSVAS